MATVSTERATRRSLFAAFCLRLAKRSVLHLSRIVEAFGVPPSYRASSQSRLKGRLRLQLGASGGTPDNCVSLLQKPVTLRLSLPNARRPRKAEFAETCA